MSLGIQPKIDSLGQRRSESMAQESEMHKTWPETEFSTLWEGHNVMSSFPQESCSSMGSSPKWSHAECLFRDKWLLLPNKLEGRAALEKFSAAHVQILLWRAGISQSQPGQLLFSKPAFQESSSLALSPSALGSGAQQCSATQLSLPFQPRGVSVNLSGGVGISSGEFWQEVKREKETCPECVCFDFGLSMPLGLE